LDIEDLPDDPVERISMFQNFLVAWSTGGKADEPVYKAIRTELMNDAALKPLVPKLIRACRDLGQLWPQIQSVGGYADRRKYWWENFRPLIDHLELKHVAPIDTVAASVLASFDVEGVHKVWQKALERRLTDPEGAITISRTLVETVCKQILDSRGVPYKDKDELPTLYGLVSSELNLAPNQHTEEAFKAILGNCTNIVNTIGTIRNRIGDAHGRGGRPVKPAPRHASLTVNLAGAIATFLIETLESQKVAK